MNVTDEVLKTVLIIFEMCKMIAGVITIIFFWLATTLYLFYNVSVQLGQMCFYTGIMYIMFSLLTSPLIYNEMRKVQKTIPPKRPQ